MASSPAHATTTALGTGAAPGSREAVLHAAERLIAEPGHEAATVAALVKRAGIPTSAIHHYLGAKELLALMERGARRFFAELPVVDRRADSGFDFHRR